MSITGVGNSSLSNQVNFKSGFASQKPPIPPFAETCSDNKKSKTVKYAAGAVALAATVAAGIALKGKFSKVKAKPFISSLTQNPDGSETVILNNGKKIIKSVTETPEGVKTVETKLFNPDGTHAYTKTKTITKTVDENGNTVINKKCHYESEGFEIINIGEDNMSSFDMGRISFNKQADREITRSYDALHRLTGTSEKVYAMPGIGNNPCANKQVRTFDPQTGKLLTEEAELGRCWDGISPEHAERLKDGLYPLYERPYGGKPAFAFDTVEQKSFFDYRNGENYIVRNPGRKDEKYIVRNGEFVNQKKS